RLCETIVNRQLLIWLEPGKMHMLVQAESRALSVERFPQRAVTQQHQVPGSTPNAAGAADPGLLRPVSIFRVSSDEPQEIFLLDKPRRRKKVILRQPIFLSDLRLLTSDLLRLSAEILVIDYIVSGKDS